MGDGHVLEGNVELGGAAGELVADALGDGLALGDELGGVELGDDGLEDFVADGGEDTLIVVGAEVLVNVVRSWLFKYLVALGRCRGPNSPGKSWEGTGQQGGAGLAASS